MIRIMIRSFYGGRFQALYQPVILFRLRWLVFRWPLSFDSIPMIMLGYLVFSFSLSVYPGYGGLILMLGVTLLVLLEYPYGYSGHLVHLLRLYG